MWRRLLWTAGLAVVLGGCASGPMLENPLLFRPDRAQAHENPIYIPQGPMAYARVFETIEDILADYFDIAYANRYDGRIETKPKIAPGIEQWWKPGSPDLYQRLLAFTQTIRHRALVSITTADDGGYFVDVKVLKELEDLPQPMAATVGDATIRLEPTVQRQYEIVVPDFTQPGWIPIGRDVKLEQVILDRLARMDLSCPPG
ncbi:MAG: hypothetical protein U0736_07780 [Gemmataceae bacterium]